MSYISKYRHGGHDQKSPQQAAYLGLHVERNLLAAEYLGRILERDAHLSLRTVRDVSALSGLALGERPSALITTEEGMSMPMPEFVAASRRLWPGSAVVFVANPEFGGKYENWASKGQLALLHITTSLKSLLQRSGELASAFLARTLPCRPMPPLQTEHLCSPCR